MNLNLNLNDITKQFKHIYSFLQRYASIIFIVSVLGIYSMLIWQIGTLSRTEPSETEVSEQLKTVTQINQESIDKIQQLRDQNVRVQSLFKEARDNPFQE